MICEGRIVGVAIVALESAVGYVAAIERVDVSALPKKAPSIEDGDTAALMLLCSWRDALNDLRDLHRKLTT